MKFFINAATFLALGAISLRGFVKFAMNECKNFQIAPQNGKTFVITGGNSGIGFYTALFLAANGGQVIISSRSATKGAEAKEKILSQHPNADVTVLPLDLSSYQSIKTFASKLISEGRKIDALINNAGVMAIPTREVTLDGLEMQIGTNHFGHFLLTSLLLPLIKPNGRIVNHASSAHMFASQDFVTKDLLSEKSYDPWIAYANSKLSNLYFTYELNKRLSASGSSIRSIAVHPGT